MAAAPGVAWAAAWTQVCVATGEPAHTAANAGPCTRGGRGVAAPIDPGGQHLDGDRRQHGQNACRRLCGGEGWHRDATT